MKGTKNDPCILDDTEVQSLTDTQLQELLEHYRKAIETLQMIQEIDEEIKRVCAKSQRVLRSSIVCNPQLMTVVIP